MGAGDAGEDVEQEEHIDSDDMTVSSDGRASSLAVCLTTAMICFLE